METHGEIHLNLYRYAEVSKACNQRFLDTMVDIIPVRSTLEEIGTVCGGKTVKGKRIPGFNVWAPDMVRIMKPYGMADTS